MKIWWLVDPQRLAFEKRAVEAIARDEDWFEFTQFCVHQLNLAVTGVIISHGHRYPVRLIYPDQFPQVPAWVAPQEDEKWSTHQYGSGGSLCLELRPDNWQAAATGADVLRSAYNLLKIENPLGKKEEQASAPSEHRVGEIQSYAWFAHPVLIGIGCRDRLMAGKAQNLKALRWLAYDEIWPILVHDSEDHTTPRHPPAADFGTWRFEIPVFLSMHPPPAEASDRQGLIDTGGFQEKEAEEIATTEAALVMFAGGTEVMAYHLTPEGKTNRRSVYVLQNQKEVRSGRTPEAQVKHVAIVGAGSVGSKLADSLVRSGVSSLTLVDGDIMLPGNLERHVLDWRDVGFHKVYGLRRHLHHIVPGADIRVIDQNLNWQRSVRTHASQVESISNCDVIVDATSDAATALFLGAIATENNLPFVSIEVFEGGIGALVATCLPDRDPPFTQARAGFLEWCKEVGAELPKSGDHPYEAINEEGAPMVADDAAVTMAAGHATRIILDILDGKEAAPEAAWLLIGFRKAWVFDRHGHTIRLNVGVPSMPEKESPDAETHALIEKLAKELRDAIKACQ